MFKPVEECIELHKQGVTCDTGFEYVFNCEEVWFDCNKKFEEQEFNINGNIKAQLEEIRENGDLDVTNGRNIYAEFTQVICPAYKS